MRIGDCYKGRILVEDRSCYLFKMPKISLTKPDKRGYWKMGKKSNYKMKSTKKQKKICESCGSGFTYIRKDGSVFCRKCGFDSREEKEDGE